MRLTEELVARLPERVEERGPVRVQSPAPEWFRDTAETLLAAQPPGAEVWIFAAGSLIWKPRFQEVERHPARVEGWRRAFCLQDRRFRGSPAAPGLMMSIDRGGECHGFILRMKPGDRVADLAALLEQEPPVPPHWVAAETARGVVPALAFVAEPDFPLYQPEPPPEALADMLASAVGHGGTMARYLLETVRRLEAAGLHDAHLWWLQAAVAERLERLPPRPGPPR